MSQSLWPRGCEDRVSGAASRCTNPRRCIINWVSQTYGRSDSLGRSTCETARDPSHQTAVTPTTHMPAQHTYKEAVFPIIVSPLSRRARLEGSHGIIAFGHPSCDSERHIQERNHPLA
jgi:hypothetical protein